MSDDMEAPGAIAVERGCGRRQSGGTYLESGLVDDGVPIETLLIDPPRPLDGLVVPRRGVVPLEIGGITHVLDVVGEDSYPYVSDFVQEAKKWGASRRVPRTFDFSLLSEGSSIFFIHARALIHNPEDLHPYRCPQEKHTWEETPGGCPVCIGACWQAIEGQIIGDHADPLLVRRDRPSVTYQGRRVPEGKEVRYETAFFLRLPITRIAVVKGGKDQDKILERTRQSSLPVAEVDE